MRNIYLIIAKQVVEEAGKIIREARETNTFGFNFKEDNTPVSNIDQQVQDYMTKRLKDSFDIQVIGEENCDEIDITKPYWAIDPIDGTWSFICQENTSAINLSLIENNEVIVAIVYNPFTNEFFQTEKGADSFIGMLKLPLRRATTPVEVVNFKAEREHPIVPTLNELYKEDKVKKLTSIGGSTAYSMCMVAKGAFSNYIAYFPNTTNPWDLSAACLIIRNSGGYVTDMEGNDINPIKHKGYIIASATKSSKIEFLDMLKSKSKYVLNVKIGVTGHRKVSNINEIREVIDDEIKKIRTNRKDTNFSIYSPLADGADRFVAKSTIELLDAKLIVPIPFKLNEYLKDFNESSKKEFEKILENNTYIELSNYEDQENDKPIYNDKRNCLYKKCGEYVVDNSEILFVIWDGKEAKGTGGTAEIVEYAKNKEKKIIHINSNTFEVKYYN